VVARREAHLADERGGAKCRQGARRSVAVPNGEGVASGSATRVFILVQDLVLDNYFCSLMGCEYVKKV